MKHSFKKTTTCIFLFLWCISNSALSRVTIIAPFYPNDPLENFIISYATHNILQESELFFIANNATEKEILLIKEYQSIFSQIRFIKGTDEDSFSKLINQAIQASSTDLITLMRIEDWRDPAAFKMQIFTLETNHSIDVVYSDYYTSYSPNTPTDKADNWYLNELPEFNPCLLYRDIPGPHAMWRKSLHEKYGSFKEDFEFHYTWEFWNRCALNGAQFKKVVGNPSTFHFDYFNQKKILFDPEDFRKSYGEENYIRQKYSALWGNLPVQEKSFVIVTASYNNKEWYKRYCDSVLFQNYTNYRIIYIDDKSPDNTGKLVQEYCHELHKEGEITIITNEINGGALANIYKAVHSCRKDEIVLLVDGDDWLPHNDVLKHLNSVYQDPNVWLTYGQFQWFPANMPGLVFQMPYWVVEKNCIRDYRWITTHLRTFYAGLFQLIKKEDLLYENEFYAMAWDLGIMYPMVEMAGYHTKFIPEIMYVYNTANQINDSKKNLDLPGKIDLFIRAKEKYQPIQNLFG